MNHFERVNIAPSGLVIGTGTTSFSANISAEDGDGVFRPVKEVKRNGIHGGNWPGSIGWLVFPLPWQEAMKRSGTLFEARTGLSALIRKYDHVILLLCSQLFHL